MTNPGILREWADVLELTEETGVLSWRKKRHISVQATITGTGMICPYSSQKREAIRFLARRQSITQTHLISYQDRTYQIVQKKPSGQLYLELSAVFAPVILCHLYGTEQGKDELNRPRKDRVRLLTFPGVLSEKSADLQEETGYHQAKDVFILTAPKQVKADEGKLVKIQENWYQITACHWMDEFWNHYELTRKADV